MRQRCKYCVSIHLPRQCLAYGKMHAVCRKTNHFREVCRSKKLYITDSQNKWHQDEDDIDKVNINHINPININSITFNSNININPININFITFNSKCSIKTANLNTLSSQATSVIPYKLMRVVMEHNAFSYT